MPIFHCMECEHEWEASGPNSLCDWCNAAGYVISEFSPLEQSLREPRTLLDALCESAKDTVIINESELDTLRMDSAEWTKLVSELCQAKDEKFRLRIKEDLVISCVWCRGTGHDGHDTQGDAMYNFIDRQFTSAWLDYYNDQLSLHFTVLLEIFNLEYDTKTGIYFESDNNLETGYPGLATGIVLG